MGDLHTVLSDVITIMTRNEFPLTVPPRYLVELFGVLERVVALRMEAHRWSIRPSVPLDAAGQAFVEAILKNMDNDKRRSQRQHVSISVGDSGQALLQPEDDPLVPPIPPSFPWGHLPHLWHEIPRADTPKRERAEDDTSTDVEMSRRPPKRRASGASTSDTGREAPSDRPRRDVATSVLLQPQLPSLVTTYGTSNRTQPQLRYSLSEIMKNPPSPLSLLHVFVWHGTGRRTFGQPGFCN